MKSIPTLLLVLLFALLPSLFSAQTPENNTLFEILTPTTTNEAASLLFPPAIVSVETPIAVRYVLLNILSTTTIDAACHPKALGFLGTKDPISPDLCKPLPRLIMSWYIQYRLLQTQFPLEAKPIAEFLQRNGLEPLSTSRNVSTEIGWANVVSDPLVEYFENDGWNSLGDKSRTNFRQQYQDSTGYKPQNNAETDVDSLPRPLRWQPLIQPSDDRGRFTSQVHVTPHLGITGKPLVLTKKQFMEKTVPSPYKSPNMKGKIGKQDLKLMKKQVRDLLRRNRNLTEEQIVLAHWWDNKFFSLGSFLLVYQPILGIDRETAFRYALGETMAQHDSLLVGWKEKVRHDLVRPTTMVRRLFKGKKIKAFKSLEEGVGFVKAEEWEPIFKVMPHSEFPSGSALLCSASLNHLRVALSDFVGGNGTIPPFETVIPPGSLPGSPVNKPISVRFENFEEAARSCGESRLLAGLHFDPSVPAGYKLAEGIGEMAFKHVTDLYEGRVPESCERCKQK